METLTVEPLSPEQRIRIASQQLRVATSKAILTADERAVIDYIAGWSIDNLDIGTAGVLGVSPATIAEETGMAKWTVGRVLFGYRASSPIPREAKGLVDRGVIKCWRRGAGQSEGVFSINWEFDEWAISWRPKSRREVLLELANLAFSARMRAEKPDFFAARARGATGSDGVLWMPFSRRKRRVSSARARGGDEVIAPRDARGESEPPDAGATISLFPSETSTSQKEKNGAPHTLTETPGAIEVLGVLLDVTGRSLFDPPGKIGPRFEVVQAVCDIDDVGYICDALRRMVRPKWPEAVQAVKDLARRGPTGPRGNGFDPGCPECHGKGFTIDDAGNTDFCPVCRGEEATR